MTNLNLFMTDLLRNASNEVILVSDRAKAPLTRHESAQVIRSQSCPTTRRKGSERRWCGGGQKSNLQTMANEKDQTPSSSSASRSRRDPPKDRSSTSQQTPSCVLRRGHREDFLVSSGKKTALLSPFRTTLKESQLSDSSSAPMKSLPQPTNNAIALMCPEQQKARSIIDLVQALARRAAMTITSSPKLQK